MEPIEKNDKFENTIVEINDLLDKMEAEHNLPPNTAVQYPECLSMNITELRKKTAEDLSEYGLEINRYCLYLQRVINKKRAIGRWAKAKLDEVQAFYITEIGTGFGYNERPVIARYNFAYCQQLNQVIRQMDLEENRFWDVITNIRAMNGNLTDLKFNAMRKEKEYSSNND